MDISCHAEVTALGPVLMLRNRIVVVVIVTVVVVTIVVVVVVVVVVVAVVAVVMKDFVMRELWLAYCLQIPLLLLVLLVKDLDSFLLSIDGTPSSLTRFLLDHRAPATPLEKMTLQGWWLASPLGQMGQRLFHQLCPQVYSAPNQSNHFAKVALL